MSSAIKQIRKLKIVIASALLLIASFVTNAQDDASLANANQKAAEDSKKFFSYFGDWAALSYATYAGGSDAEVQSLFNTLLKDYSTSPILQEILQVLGETNDLENVSKNFFNNTGVRTYFVGEFRPEDVAERFQPIIEVLNKSLQAKLKNTVTPNIIVTTQLDGNKETGFRVNVETKANGEINAKKYKLDRTGPSNPFIGPLVTTAETRTDAAQNIRTALIAGVTSLSADFKENFLPPLLIVYQDDRYKTGEELEVAQGAGLWADIYILNDRQQVPSGNITWTITPENEETARAEIDGNHFRFPLDQAGSYTLTAKAGNDQVEITLKVSGIPSINDLLRELLQEVLQPMLEAQASRVITLVNDSASTAGDAAKGTQDLEAFNYPIEEGNNTLAPLLEQPRVLGGEDTILFNTDQLRRETMRKLRKQKTLALNLSKGRKLVKFIQGAINNRDTLQVVLDDLVANSGTVLGNITVSMLDGEGRENTKSIIVDYLNENLSRIAGEEVTLSDLQPLSIIPNSQIPDAYDPSKNYYINPKLPYTEQEFSDLENQIIEYQADQANPPFVVVNYSQDLSEANYMERANKGAPVGLAAGQEYVVVTVLNSPGSILEFELTNDDETWRKIKGGKAANQGLIGDKIAQRLKNLQNQTGYEYLAILHCESCEEETPTYASFNLPTTPQILDISSDFNVEIPTFYLPDPNGNQIPLVADKAEYVSKDANACFVLYFRSNEEQTLIETNQGIFSGDADEAGLKIEPQLTLFDKNNQFNEINCNGQMGAWGKAICPKQDNTLPNLEDTYFDNLLTQLEICLDNENPSYASRISNYTSGRLSLSDEQFIYELYDGQKSIGSRHNTKAHLIITDHYSSEAQMTAASNYVAKEGEVIIWIHQGVEGIWEFKSTIPDPVGELFDLQVNNPDDPKEKWYSMDNMLKYLATGVYATDQIATGLYEAFDWLGNGVRKARIPDYVWNCDAAGYDERYSKVYYYATYTMSAFQNILRERLLSYVDKGQIDPKWHSCLDAFREGQVDLAFQAGLYNGIIEIVGSVFDLGELISGLGSSKGREDMSNFLDQLEGFQKEGADGLVECSGTWCAIVTGLEEQFDPTKCCQFAGLVGEIVGPIVVSIFLPNAAAAAAETTAGRVLFQVSKIFTWLDKASDPFQYIGGGLRYLGQGVSVIRSKANKLLIRIENGIVKAKVIIDQEIVDLNKSLDAVELVTDNGYLAIRETGDGTTTAYRVVSGELADLAKALTDKGARLAKITQLSDLIDDVGPLLNRVDKMGLEGSDLNAFLDDLVDSKAFRDKVAGLDVIDGSVDKLARAWKRLAILGRNQMRKDPDILASMGKAIDNPDISSTRLDDIVNSLANGSARCKTCTNPGKDGLRYVNDILDDLDQFATEFNEVDGFDEFLKEMGESGRKATGGSWTLEALMRNRKKYFNDEEITGFEVNHVQGRDFAADVVSKDGDKLFYNEFKNWGSSQLTRSESTFVDQLTGTLSVISELDEMRFVFNPNRWTPNAAKIRAALKSKTKPIDDLPVAKKRELFQTVNTQEIIDILVDDDVFSLIFKID